MPADRPIQELPSLLTQQQPAGRKPVAGKASQALHTSEHRAPAPRAAFCAVSLKGHLRLAKAVATELVGRGFAVDFLIDAAGASEDLLELETQHEGFKLHAIRAGSELIAAMDWQKVASSTGRFGGSKVALMEEVAKLNTEEIQMATIKQWGAMIKILEGLQPDVVICDHAMQPLQLWAEYTGIPSIILHTPYFTTAKPGRTAEMSSWQILRLMWVMRQKQPLALFNNASELLGIGEVKRSKEGIGEGAAGARKASGVSPHTFVFCEPELLNCDFKEVPERVHIVGPCFGDVGQVDEELTPWLDMAAELGQRVAYVSLGTLANGFLNKRAARQMLSAFHELGEGWRVLWSLPKAQQHLVEGKLKDSQVKVASFVRQRAVLAHPAVSVFLTHGGQSSANEGIFAGVPLVCMPLFCDQFEVADAVERHGLGLVCHKDELLSAWGAGGHVLAELLKRAAEEEQFRSSIARHQSLMQLRSGSHRAAEVVESVVRGGADYQELWRPVATRPAESVGCGTCILNCFRGVF